MHIIIGLLTTTAGLIWALHALQNSDFDLNSLNPFYYARRRKWQNTYGARAILNIDEPMTLGAVMILGVADQLAMIDAFSNQYNFKRATNSKWG